MGYSEPSSHAEGVFDSGNGWSKRFHPRRRHAAWFSIIRVKGAHWELAANDAAAPTVSEQSVRACGGDIGSSPR
jgi:hypothetical protein